MRRFLVVVILLSGSIGIAKGLTQEPALTPAQEDRANLVAEIDRLYIVNGELRKENGELREKIGILEHSAKGDASALENRKLEKRYD